MHRLRDRQAAQRRVTPSDVAVRMFCNGQAAITRASWLHSISRRSCRQVAACHGRAALTRGMQGANASQQASGRASADDQSQACDIEAHLSKEAQARTLSSLSKFIFSFSGIPDMVSLHGGLPNASIFPFKSLKVELGDGTWLDMSNKEKVCLLLLTQLLSMGRPLQAIVTLYLKPSLLVSNASHTATQVTLCT